MIWLSLIAYTFIPMLSTPLLLLGLYIDNKNYKFYIFGLVLNLALIGYYFVPQSSDDLSRHFINMDILSLLSIKDIFGIFFSPDSTIIHDNGLLIKNLWFYLISKTNNYSLLPLSAIIITYYFVIKDIFSFGRKEKLAKEIVFTFLFILIAWYQLILPMSGIRFTVAITLFSHGLYKELIENKKKWSTYTLYILPLFIHHAGFVLIMVRILLFFFKKAKIVTYVLILFWGTFVQGIVTILSNLNFSYISGIVEKANDYENYTNTNIINSFLLIVKLFFCIVFLITYFVSRKRKYPFFYKYRELYSYGIILSLICIGGVNLVVVPNRFSYLIICILPFILMPLLQYSKSKLFKQLFYLSAVPFILGGFFIQYLLLEFTSYDISLFELFGRNIMDLLFK